MTIYELAHAKINLLLDVVGKRPDGFHELRTIFQSLSLYDTLSFSDNRDGTITLACNNPDLPTGDDNLAWRAAVRLRERYRITEGVHIMLEKRIPVAAGLGGGSSDAAAVLRGLARFWGLTPDPAALQALAAELGSDVPFCLTGGTALGTGRGERVQPLPPCPAFHVVLANPGFPVSTAQVYQSLSPGISSERPDVDGMIAAIQCGSAEGVGQRLANILEQSTFALYPAVSRLKEKMQQSAPALMCGSGATVFALFRNAAAAKKLHQSLLAEGTASWLTETTESIQEGCAHV